MEKLKSREEDGQLNNEEILSPEVQLPETFEDVKNIVEDQAERIEVKAKEKGYDGLLSRLSTSGRKLAGVALISLSSFAVGCGKSPENNLRTPENNLRNYITASNIVETDKGNFAVDMGGSDLNSYNVTPDVFALIKGVREKYKSKYQEIKSNHSNAPVRRIELALKEKEKREINAIIKHSEKLTENNVPSSIKQAQEERKEKRKKEADNLQARNLVEDLANNKKEGEKIDRVENTGVETGREITEETPEQKLKRRIKEIREIEAAPSRETPVQKFENIMKESKEIETMAPGEIHNPTKLEELIKKDQELAEEEKRIAKEIPGIIDKFYRDKEEAKKLLEDQRYVEELERLSKIEIKSIIDADNDRKELDQIIEDMKKRKIEREQIETIEKRNIDK